MISIRGLFHNPPICGRVVSAREQSRFLIARRVQPMLEIDLNSDVGESFGRWALGDDEAMMLSVTSANVACGFHAGDPSTLRRTCALAAQAGVTVGAQVGYRDLAGFGRRFIDM